MGKIISILNHKGGVGKTTTSLNLAYYLGQMHKKVLIVDIDPQGSTTSAFGIDKIQVKRYNPFSTILLKDGNVNKTIMSTKYMLVDVIPSTTELISTSLALRENGFLIHEIIRKKINPLREKYDYIIFDCPPSFGDLNESALACSDSVIIPTQCEYFAYESLMQLMSYIRSIKVKLNSKLKLDGILLTMFSPTNKMAVEVIREIKTTFKNSLYETVIPRNSKLVEAAVKRIPIQKLSPQSTGARSYKAFTKEFIERNEGGK